MSDQNEKNLNQPEEGQDDFSSMSIDELIASTKEEIARIDQMMGTSRLPQQEDAQEPAPQQGAPQAGEVSLDDETDDKAKPSQSEPFEPKLPEEYADLSLDSDEQPEQDEQPQRAHLAAGVKVLLYVCCVLAASVLLAVFGWRLADDVLALTKPDEEITITVPENATVADVSRELKEKGLIEYEWLFRFYCLYSHAERKIQPGTYELNHLYDYHALVNGMTPSAGVRATTEVTIPEGYECEDIFALLEEAGVASAADLEQAAANYEFDYAFLQDLPYGDKNRLEGYLFPDTYQFYLNDKPENVLGRFLRNFESKITDDMYAALDELNAKLEEKMRANGFEESEIESAKLSFHDVVIVASLVEKETAKTSESASIASVIYNRLCSKLYPCLQIDATIQYALDERKEVLSNADKAIISPYNTYTNAGLPAGPIANPGINSIRAALYPADTDYYFYALGEDGVHKFSKTYYEHQDFLASLAGETADEEIGGDAQQDTGAEGNDADAQPDAAGTEDGGNGNGKKTGASLPGGRYGKAADGGFIRRRCGLSGGYKLRYALVHRKFYA